MRNESRIVDFRATATRFMNIFVFLWFLAEYFRKEIDGILADGVLVSHTEGRIIEARVSHRKSS